MGGSRMGAREAGRGFQALQRDQGNPAASARLKARDQQANGVRTDADRSNRTWSNESHRGYSSTGEAAGREAALALILQSVAFTKSEGCE
jgi:hypothetical protein